MSDRERGLVMPTADGPRWDGRDYPYIPPKDLQIAGHLPMHTEVAATFDGVTHEVLRHALWNINVEHGNTIVKISGSPIAAYGHDFNPALLDESGDFVFFGPFLQYMAAALGAAVKWTLENRSENPGIHDGDIFLTNDPWIGATHQSDVSVMAPVFWDGAVFAWVANALHQWDLGGTGPGGFSPVAQDIYWETPCIPPVKIVENGVVRRDIEEHYLRSSRVPKLVALDLRAQIAGCNVARQRLMKVIERYGAGTVKRTMRKLQSDSEAAFIRRLDTIPDGEWSEEGWMEVSLPGDRQIYRNSLSLTKRGHTLTFSNAGSAPQTGTLNGVFAGWKGAVVAMLASQMLFDQMFVIEGALRHCEFDVEPGTISCATRPAAVSCSAGLILPQSIGLGGLVISKMLATSRDPDLRSEVQSCMGCLSFPINALHGTDQRGNQYSSFLLDAVGSALSAYSWRDGQDTGGWSWDLQSTMPNVEDNELFYPLLYLWRRELPDSGGAGRYRGGNGAEFAFVPHGTEDMNIWTITNELTVPGPGLFGGYPSSTHKFQMVTGANVQRRAVEGGRMPTHADDLVGATVWPSAKSFDLVLTPLDAWICAWAGSSGYGDPLDREPEQVLADVAAGRVTEEWARRAYGVVVTTGADGGSQLDGAGTSELRTALREERRRESTPAGNEHLPPAPHETGQERLSEYLVVADGTTKCSRCGHTLGPSDANYKSGALTREVALPEMNPHIRDPQLYVDNVLMARQFYCPGCLTLLQTEVTVDGAEPRWDLRIVP